MAVVKIVELIGSSPNDWEDATKNALALQTLFKYSESNNPSGSIRIQRSQVAYRCMEQLLERGTLRIN